MGVFNDIKHKRSLSAKKSLTSLRHAKKESADTEEDSLPIMATETIQQHQVINEPGAIAVAVAGRDESNDPLIPLLASNRTFQHHMTTRHPTLLPSLATSQHPHILWLGCSDSRVPETTLLNLLPGSVFVHRNIANIITPTDISADAVIEYAVSHLRVRLIVVAGHTGCGGVAAALALANNNNNNNHKRIGGCLDTWISPLRELRATHARELDRLPSDADRAQRLVELNVRRGVDVVNAKPCVVSAFSAQSSSGTRERDPPPPPSPPCPLQVRGCVYDVGRGELREVDCSGSDESKY